MAVSKTQVLPLRGNVIDLIQHHNWLLLATTHSEKKNLGIQFLPIVNVQNRITSERWIIDTPRPITKFVALPNQPTPPMSLVIEEQSLEPNWIDNILLQEKVLRKALKKEKQNRGTKEELSVADVQKILTQELKFSNEPSEIEKRTLSYVAKIFEDKKAVRELKKHFEQSRETHRFSHKYLPNQRIVCVDDSGIGYHLPYIPSEADFDGDTSNLSLVPFSLKEKITFMEGYDHHHVILVVVKEDQSEWVYIYNLDDNQVVFEMTAPQAKEGTEEQPTEKQEESTDNQREITALAVDVGTKMFGLGFDDSLYLMFKRRNDKTAIEFERLELRDLEKKELTVASNFEQTGHKGAIIGLHFSLSTDDVLHLTAFSNDLSMSRLKVKERIPLKIAESSKMRHSKNIRRFVKGPGYFFYSLSWDNTLRMWQTDKNFSKVMSLSATSICVARIPTKDRMGRWRFQEMLFSGHDAAVSATGRRDTAEISVRNIDITDNGVIKESIKKQFFGVWHYSQDQMNKEPKFRSELLTYLSDFGDQLVVDLLIQFVKREGHPPLIKSALDLLNETKHPRLPVIFKDLMEIDREATCLKVFEYLRMEHLYGKNSLFPLELANASYFLTVRQAALRGYAELAARREVEPEKTFLQTAFERILELFNEDDEDDIVDNAFHFLFAQEKPFLPGVEGVLIAVAHRHKWIQERGLKLLYFKNMLKDSTTKDAALDLLRQVRDSSNEDLRNVAFLLSLTAESAVQTYLRSLDDVLHGQLVDMELEAREAFWNSLSHGFDLDQDVVKLFSSAVPEEKREEKNINMQEAQEIIRNFEQMMGDQIDYLKLRTFSYCIQTFPMNIDVKEYLLAARHDVEFPKPQLERDLELEEEMLLQEMALSYQPSIAALGAMALAKLGRHSALPILLLLVDDKNELVKSRAVDGLLEFIHEPVVAQKLRLLVLQAPNEQVKRNSRDKAEDIRILVREESFHISHYVVDRIVDMIFKDNVYSHTERLCVRYLFESTEISFSSGSRSALFKKIREKGEHPKEINIRAKVLRALYKKAETDGESHLQKLLGQTLESPFDDIRVLAVVRLQERIRYVTESNPEWRTQWSRYTDEEWTEFVKLHGGGLISEQDIQSLSINSDVDPTMSLVGFPKPLLIEMQLLNRVLFWRGHESMAELIKTYVKYNFVNADFIDTRRFLLSLPVPEIFDHLLTEIKNNVQDTMIKVDSTVENWHESMWDDYFQHEDKKRAESFYRTIDTTIRQPRTPEEKKVVTEGGVIPPYVPFLKATFESKHVSLQKKATKEMLNHFNDAWVCDYIQRTFDSSESSLRQIGVGEKSLRVLHHNGLLREALLYLLKSKHTDMLVKALDILFFPSSEDMKTWVEGMIDDSVMEIILSRMGESLSDKSWITTDFVHDHFVNQGMFAKIPKPVLFGRNYEEEYFSLLQKLFIYETQEDIQDELDAYNKRRKEIDDLLDVYKGQRESSNSTDPSFSLGEDGVDLSDVYKYIGEGSNVKAINAYREQMGLGLKEAKDAVEQLIEKINLLRAEKRILRKPTRRIDNRFFDILKLLTVAKGAWADELLQLYLSNFDEKLSNEAFLVYFTRGVTRGDAEVFLKNMVRDNHPRLDDVFGMILSEKYGSIRSMKNVLFSCTRLSRIDLVFQSFDALANAGLVDDDAWEALLQSPHDFLRYRALQHFVNHKKEDVRTKMLEEMYSTFILEPCPKRERDLITPKELKQLLQKKQVETVHAYIKNGRTLKFTQLEALRKRFPMSPGFIRRIMNSDIHILVSGLNLESAQSLLDECKKLNVVIVLSKTNPLYFDETLDLWQNILTKVLRYIRDGVWTTDDVVCDNLLKLERHLEESPQVVDNTLQKLAVEATGSVAGPANFEEMYTYLDEAFEYEIAKSLVRSGNTHGMRYMFGENKEAICAMIALQGQTESFVERTLYGALGPKLQKQAIQLWLMQLAHVGGKSDLMMTMLSGSEDMMLMSAQLLGDLFDKDVFLQRVIELLKLEKIQLSRIPNDVHFNSIDGWKSSMKALRKVYEKHYCVEVHSEKLPLLSDLRSAQKTMKSEEKKRVKRKEEAKKKGRKVGKEDTDALQKAKEEYRKISNQMSSLRVSEDEWKWFAKHLVVSNPRLRYYVTAVLLKMLTGDINRKEMLEEQEFIETVLTSIENEFSVFEPFSLNGVVLTQESAVSFGFGTLAGMIRNQRNISTSIRRKGLASLIQLAKKHPISTVPAVLSVAFNDPSKTVRQDAFALALVEQESLGLRWETTVRQAINSVSLRNAQEVTSNSDQYDSLNQLIVSELDRAERSDLLLELIRTQPHHLGFVALDLVLNRDIKDQKSIIDGLQTAIESPNEIVRRRLVGFIKQALTNIYKYNESILPLMATDPTLEYLDDAPYWAVLVHCLKHGVEHIREEAVLYLVKRNKNRGAALDFIYGEWLGSMNKNKQNQACQALIALSPPEASLKILERLIHDPTETSHHAVLRNTLLKLNQYDPDLSAKLIQRLNQDTWVPNISDMCFELLVSFSGFVNKKSKRRDHQYRIELLCELLETLKENSHFDQVQTVVKALLLHPCQVSAQLDQILSDISINTKSESLLPLRTVALKVCIYRYHAMTPLLKDISKEKYKEKPVLDTSWEGSNWEALHQALRTNLNYHPIASKRKEYLSKYQKMSAMALIAVQLDNSETFLDTSTFKMTFSTIRKILEDGQYALTERAAALEALAVTAHPDLLAPLCRLIGLGNNKILDETIVLSKTPDFLYNRALSLIGLYHDTDRGTRIETEAKDSSNTEVTIVDFLLERLLTSSSYRRPHIIRSLWNFTTYSVHQIDLIKVLLQCNTKNNQSWLSEHIDIAGFQDDPTTLRVWLEMLMFLYKEQFAESISPLLAKEEEDIRSNVLHHLWTTNVNQIYEFYLAYCADETMELDLKLWTHHVRIFLSQENREKLWERLTSHGDTKIWMSLLLESIQKSIQQLGSQSVVEQVFLEVEENRQKRRQLYPNQDSRILLPDIKPLQSFLSRNISIPKTELLFVELLKRLEELSDEVVDWVVGVYHQNRMGEFFVFDKEILFSMTSVIWKSEVNDWEKEISKTTKGTKFYVDLLDQYLHEDSEILTSIFDMLKNRSFEEQDKVSILSVISNLRQEWNVLQAEKTRGIRNQDQIVQVEQRWLNALPLISILDVEGEELSEILCESQTSFELKEKALDLYLARRPAQDILQHVYQNYPVFESKVSPFMTLSSLQSSVIQSMGDYGLFKGRLEKWTEKIDSNLKKVDVLSEMLWLQENMLVTSDIDTAITEKFSTAVRSGSLEEIKNIVKVKDNRNCIRLAVMYKMIADVIEKDEGLSSMYWATVNQGRWLHNVVQHLYASVNLPSQQFMTERFYFNEEIFQYTTLINESYRVYFQGSQDLLQSSNEINLFTHQHSETRQKIGQILQRLFYPIEGEEEIKKSNTETDLENNGPTDLSETSIEEWQDILDYGLGIDMSLEAFLQEFVDYDPSMQKQYSVYVALATAQDGSVREHYARFAPVYSKYRSWSDKAQRSRSNRFSKELS